MKRHESNDPLYSHWKMDHWEVNRLMSLHGFEEEWYTTAVLPRWYLCRNRIWSSAEAHPGWHFVGSPGLFWLTYTEMLQKAENSLAKWDMISPGTEAESYIESLLTAVRLMESA